MWDQNLTSFLLTLFAFLLFGVLWVLPWRAMKEAPQLLRRSLWLLPPFVLLHYVVAVVQEVRLFLPLAPIIIPLSWWVLFPEAHLHMTAATTPARAGAPPRLRRMPMRQKLWWRCLPALLIFIGAGLLLIAVLVGFVHLILRLALPLGLLLFIAGLVWLAAKVQRRP